MADVARRSGVSTQTVSRYFSGQGYVSEETRARIAGVVEELGYVRNRAAGSLRANRTGTIGVLNVGELNWGSAQILAGLSAGARRAGRALMIAEIDPDQGPEAWREDARAAIDHFLAAPVDGIIVSTAMQGSEEVFAAARERVPVVNLSARPRTPDGAADHPSATGYDATRHLLELGHRRIAHLVGPRDRNESLDREAGYLRAMAEAGCAPLLLEGASSWWAPSGAAAADRLEEIAFTAVFAGNDELAVGFMSRLEQRRRRHARRRLPQPAADHGRDRLRADRRARARGRAARDRHRRAPPDPRDPAAAGGPRLHRPLVIRSTGWAHCSHPLVNG
jgi:DNA-binding LacI/PurR family transcriptional regulator